MIEWDRDHTDAELTEGVERGGRKTSISLDSESTDYCNHRVAETAGVTNTTSNRYHHSVASDRRFHHLN